MLNNKPADNNRFFSRWKRQIIYAWSNVFNNIRQHLLASVLTMIVIAISITLPTIFYLVWKNAHEAAQQWYPTPNLTVYLQKYLTAPETDALLDKLRAYPQIAKVDYMNREATLEEFRDWSGFSDALDLLEENPLPAVAILAPTEAAKQTTVLHALQKELKQLDGVDDVRLDDSWFTRLTAFTGMIKSLVWAISILMIIAVFLVISNSIRLMIFARRQTITVMQLIGATEGFILRPFLYSGMLYGCCSAVIALLLAQIFVYQIEATILNVSSVFGTIFTIHGLTWDESLAIILLATIIGWLSAWLATRKFLRHATITN